MPKSRRVISILCVISICVSTFLFSFSSSASTEAGTYSKTFTVNQTLDDFGLNYSNVSKPFETVEVDQEQYTYFYRQFGGQNVFTTHQDVFAYKVKVEPISCTSFGDQIDYCRLVLGTQDELSRGDWVQGSLLNGSNVHYFWYFNNYQTMPIYLALMVKAHTFNYITSNNEGGANIEYPSYSYQYSATVTYTLYTEEDYLDEIYAELVEQTGQNEEMITLLTNIKNSNNNIYSKLSSMYTVVNNYLPKIDTELDTITGLLADIKNLLNTGADQEPPEEYDSSQLEDTLQQEGELLDKDTSSAEQELNVDLNLDANSSIWDMITNFLNINPKVFGLYISVLSLGCICLILNR